MPAEVQVHVHVVAEGAAVASARDLARAVLKGQPRSHVEAARLLAQFVLDAFPDPPAREDPAPAAPLGDLEPLA